jgi:predicted protein tyrosine phosphatase
MEVPMLWKYHLPAPLPSPHERTALEDIFLVPEDGSSGRESYWFTLEALQSFTGGTREEKLVRLGDDDYVISDHMDMLVRREDFDRAELLEWTKTFLRIRFNDANPVLAEASGDEVARCVPTTNEVDIQQRSPRKVKLVFVHHKTGPPSFLPEQILAGDPRADVRTLWLADDPAQNPSAQLFEWADLVMVMDKRMRQITQKRLKALGVKKRIICLHLPEHHDAHDPHYLTLFRERIGVYLEKLGWVTP